MAARVAELEEIDALGELDEEGRGRLAALRMRCSRAAARARHGRRARGPDRRGAHPPEGRRRLEALLSADPQVHGPAPNAAFTFARYNQTRE